MKKAQQGFTLIELMIAVAIIGILAAVAVPQFQGYVTRSKIGGDPLSLAKGATTDIAKYFGDYGVMPADSTDLGKAIIAGFDKSPYMSGTKIVLAAGSAGSANAKLTLTTTLGQVGSNQNTKVFGFAWDGDSPTITFNCTKTGAGTTVANDYLPVACRE